MFESPLDVQNDARRRFPVLAAKGECVDVFAFLSEALD
jgi:hypothetical protein